MSQLLAFITHTYNTNKKGHMIVYKLENCIVDSNELENDDEANTNSTGTVKYFIKCVAQNLYMYLIGQHIFYKGKSEDGKVIDNVILRKKGPYKNFERARFFKQGPFFEKWERFRAHHTFFVDNWKTARRIEKWLK
ncbi:hypothetical protein FQA39_LY11197 [Lamprigera yunnana]|nr:hypothetical protein FQA39_LY11197 [Lamprigera yunnana]